MRDQVHPPYHRLEKSQPSVRSLERMNSLIDKPAYITFAVLLILLYPELERTMTTERNSIDLESCSGG